MGFGGESRGGIGHSIYDTFNYYTQFVDSTFQYGIALAQVGGRTMLRLANADILPIELDLFVERMKSNIDGIIEFAETLRTETEKENKLIEEEIYKIATDPQANVKLPAKKKPVPLFDFSPLQNVILKMKTCLEKYQKAKGDFIKSEQPLSDKQKNELDQIYYKAERTLVRKEGLPGREWYKHYLYAPGSYTGYGAKTLPTIREALEFGKWEDVGKEIPLVANVLEKYADQIGKAAELYEKAAK
jgi:N-acetylated-alpha-linked acidic dipeptidase